MPAYNKQQSRLSSSFPCYRTICATSCSCGRIHFVSAAGHGDYADGELEELQGKAAASPDKYIEETQFDQIDQVIIDGREIVPDCPCGSYKKYCDWIEGNAKALAEYLRQYFEASRKEAEEMKLDADAAIAGQHPPTASTPRHPSASPSTPAGRRSSNHGRGMEHDARIHHL